MASQATTVITDLRLLLGALLERQPDQAWAYAKLLLEDMGDEGPAGLPTRGDVAALLAETLSRELRQTMEQWRQP